MSPTICKHNLRFSLLFFCLLPLSVFADSNANNKPLDVEQLILKANNKKLDQSKQWLRLLHYNQGGSLHSKNKSYVNSSAFFLSPEGNTNAKKELDENIRQLFVENIQQRCVFPARFHWLSEQLELENYALGLTHCDDFLNVEKQVSAKKITLIFPSAYLNSASSVFGHTLLRIDTGANDEASILNWAVNYGAKINNKDGAIKYAVKGITGAYQGQYFIVPYSQKIKEYGQIENRDIWEYPLALSQAEVTFLTEHLWELKDINFDYFFFDENCSYRLLELLEVAKPELDLTSQLRLTEIPINTVKTLNQHHLIESTHFRPSKERLLKLKFAMLSVDEKKLSKLISKKIDAINDSSFQALNSQHQLNVLQTAYAYLRFQQSQEERNEDVAKRSLLLLQNINTISLKNNTPAEIQEADTELSIKNDGDIRQTHDSHRLRLTAGKNIDGHHYQSLQYRMAYHELLDNSEGFFKGAHIEGPSFTLKQSDSLSFVDQLTLLDIISLNPISDIRHDFSWTLGAKAERSEENNQYLHSIVYGGGGFAWEIDNFLFYQLAEPRLEMAPEFNQLANIGLEATLGLIYNNGKNPSLLELKTLKVGKQTIHYFAEFSQQIELAQNHALRAKFNYFEQEKTNSANKSFELSYLYYF